jgi:hypothetical protein
MEAYYIDKDTRIVYRFKFSALGRVHVLQRRKRTWGFGYWSDRAWQYESIISAKTRMGALIEYLQWKEQRNEAFTAYPKP